MDSFFLGTIVIGGSTFLSVAGMYLVRKIVHLEKLQSYHEVGGYLLSVLGTLYAVVLGFVVVSASQGMDQAKLNVEKEANAVADVYRLAEGFPDRNRRQPFFGDFAVKPLAFELDLTMFDGLGKRRQSGTIQ